MASSGEEKVWRWDWERHVVTGSGTQGWVFMPRNSEVFLAHAKQVLGCMGSLLCLTPCPTQTGREA